MSYLRFHSCFNFPLLTLLAVVNLVWYPDGGWMPFPFVLAAVILYTTPWDNAAAKWGIWGFPDKLHWFKIGYLPFEEYLFFVLQSLNVMLAVRLLLHAYPSFLVHAETHLQSFQGGLAVVLLAAWLGFGISRRKNLPAIRWNYAFHLFYWFAPVILLQWIIAAPVFLSHGRLLAGVTGAFGVYYTAADLAAVRAGTWFFDEKQISGFKWAGVLPWEEIAFFFLTSLLVAQSYLMLLPVDAR